MSTKRGEDPKPQSPNARSSSALRITPSLSSTSEHPTALSRRAGPSLSVHDTLTVCRHSPRSWRHRGEQLQAPEMHWPPCRPQLADNFLESRDHTSAPAGTPSGPGTIPGTWRWSQGLGCQTQGHSVATSPRFPPRELSPRSAGEKTGQGAGLGLGTTIGEWRLREGV